jgi:hypothetical protein
MSAWALRCPRCGDVDKWRVRRALVKLAIFLVAVAIVLGAALMLARQRHNAPAAAPDAKALLKDLRSTPMAGLNKTRMANKHS